jgi:hypothetical protein
MLACFGHKLVLPKNARQSQVQGNQKNRCKMEQLALSNLKRSGFVQIS